MPLRKVVGAAEMAEKEGETQADMPCGLCFFPHSPMLMCESLKLLGTKQASYPCRDW